MKFYNITTKKTFEKNGEEITRWPQVGIITKFDNGSMILELNHLPDTKFFVFEQKHEGKQEQPQTEEKDEKIKTEDIPF